MIEFTLSERKAELRRTLTQTRERTLALFAQVPEPYLKRRIHDFLQSHRLAFRASRHDRGVLGLRTSPWKSLP